MKSIKHSTVSYCSIFILILVSLLVVGSTGTERYGNNDCHDGNWDCSDAFSSRSKTIIVMSIMTQIDFTFQNNRLITSVPVSLSSVRWLEKQYCSSTCGFDFQIRFLPNEL